MRSRLPPNSLGFVSAALSETAVCQHAPAALIRGGPMQRAARLLDGGYELVVAADIAAKQGKGHIAELHQAATFTAEAGARLRSLSARPNPRANDPIIDVEVRRGGRTRGGAQVKVGSPSYVRRAVEKTRAKKVIVNHEAFEVLAPVLPSSASTRLAHRGAMAGAVSADECHRSARQAIVTALGGYPSHLDELVRCATAGAKSGLESAAISLIEDLLGAFATASPFQAERAVSRALAQGARAGARGTVQSLLLVRRFVSEAKAQFSDRLLHRIARSTIVVGAIADVVVETAIDLHAVLTRKMTLDDLVRRFGVHTTTAAGGALGVALAVHLTRGSHPALQLLAVLGLGYLGSSGGRKLGVELFLSPAQRQLPLNLTTT